MTPEYLAYEGFISLMKIIRDIKASMNVQIELLGILFTMINPMMKRNRKIAADIMDQLEADYGEYIFETRIVRSPKLGEAPAFGKSIIDYAPHSAGAREYRRLAEEVMRRCGLLMNASAAAVS